MIKIPINPTGIADNTICKPCFDVQPSPRLPASVLRQFDIPLGNPAEPRAGIFPFQYFANMIYFSQTWASSPFMRGRLIKN